MAGRNGTNGHAAPVYGRLRNAGGELIAEGPCWIDSPSRQATMEPVRTPGVIQKERGRLALELESGDVLGVNDKPIIFRLRVFERGPGVNGSKKLYRLRLVEEQAAPGANGQGGAPEHTQEAERAGGAAEGPAASQDASPRSDGETPAAR